MEGTNHTASISILARFTVNFPSMQQTAISPDILP
nr:MAG TPA: hypothetical protein [Caudoviricetes sp.]